MAENADNDTLSPSRAARRAPSKRRASPASSASPVSSDTESTLAGAAQSAPQSAPQSAQPGEPLRDESTLDLFAGDPLHAPVRSMEPEHRQGRFELQEQARQQAEAAQGTEAAVEELPHDVQAEVVTDAASRDDGHGNGGVTSEAAAAPEAAVVVPADSEFTAEAAVPQAPVLTEPDGAAVAVLPGAATTQVDEDATEPMLPGQALAQSRAVRTVAAPRPAKGGRAASRAAAADSAAAGDALLAEPGQPSGPANASGAEASAASNRPAPESRYAGDFARASAATGSAGVDAARPTPLEPDIARAVAFAETVDALNGVIADQRRTAGRTKWMLGAVVTALLVTVAAGAVQTVILSRLATDVSDQQQRIAQMMQDQQAAIAGALARLPSQTEVPAVQATSPSPVRPVTASPEHHTRHAVTHGHHARAASQ
jgi:hypothetical protein